MKILGVHGLDDHRDGGWIVEWEKCVRENVKVPAGGTLGFVAFSYDDIFEEVEISFGESMRAMAKLLGSGIQSWWEDMFRRRGFGGGSNTRGVLQTARDRIRWTAGYIVAWCEDDRQFRSRVRER